ncbi:MetQ/NlpA family ABC transporter substrate-binding protein [Metabacillus litoralis]|uniref:MetQ/NlpA family ABC transporter substrate-binding protein n=1 Tax=Bacillaceae TaxID=186817 RepID=UPI000BFC2963|nr:MULTISPECIES: MetQ/NlpA family ABC transporter substrate-binding protein [Bacillaceae]MCM3161205.1 MetQ/NlpA family ABC transporter substrate-binding protein [Metabacillus litoralis]MCM3412079.1 MetQ/NlpA family ABC transporter substrate-binding protein [Metabacillus litoralis]PGT85366.1 methionine ABC transporter substrate-binding protein [Bacillus sp. AFS040349]UHA61914.1 MetQ/NlpA family ABC transporter substrate-binding protein [Metabacillus litoralis]
MKKYLLSLVLTIFAILLVACGGGENETTQEENTGTEQETKVLKVGATTVPHAEILEEAKPLLADKGIELDIEEFSDYPLINPALAEGDLDANYFQHVPYLDNAIKENDFDLANVGAIHIEPFGIYSKEYKTLEELPEGAKIIMSNNVAEMGRVLALLEEKGLIKLNPDVDKINATKDDIVENAKNLEIDDSVAPEMLASAYENNEGDAVIINGNYALAAGLNPAEDAVALEAGENNPYANIIVVRSEDKDKEEIKTLVEVLKSQEIKDFINTKYPGSVLPVND